MQHPHWHDNKATPNGQVLTNAGCNAFHLISLNISAQCLRRGRWHFTFQNKKKERKLHRLDKANSGLVISNSGLQSNILSHRRLFEGARNHTVLQTIHVATRIRYAAATGAHERLQKDRHFSVNSNSFTSVVHQCGNGATGFVWCAEILFIRACKIRTNQLLTTCVAPGCRHITKTLGSSCLQKDHLNPF